MHRSWRTRVVACLRVIGLAFVGLSHPAPAPADLRLNEVLYDPSGPDEGAEWVELWNPDSIPRSLAGIVLEAADGSRPDVWNPVFRGVAGDSAPPRAPLLIAASALTGALQNGPDALRLSRDGAVLDLVGYGALEAVSLYQGTPAPDVVSGHSLARRLDGGGSGSNAEDWEDESRPTPGHANHPPFRLAFVPGSASIDPWVPWPGESVALRAQIENRGRLPLAAPQWRLVAEWMPAADGSGSRALPIPVAQLPGIALAVGESAPVELRFTAPGEGPFQARLQSEAPDGAPEFADTVHVAGRARAGPAVVNEVAFRDAGAGEWVELWFRETVADVGALALADGSSAPRPLARGALPRPALAGELLVVAQDPPAVRARYALDSSAVLGLAGSWPSINDTNGPGGFADLVRVIGGDSIPSDAIVVDGRAVSRGGSLERLSPDLPGHLPGTFGECVDPARGTPGRPNSLRAPEGEGAARGSLIVASARVLRRGAGAAPLLLRLTPEARGRALVVQVLDLLGRRVRTLVQGQRFSSEGAFAWDGRDGDGAWVRPGLYVIAAEARDSDALGPRQTRIPVAVAAETGAP